MIEAGNPDLREFSSYIIADVPKKIRQNNNSERKLNPCFERVWLKKA
jgi:hypothetical protein